MQHSPRRASAITCFSSENCLPFDCWLDSRLIWLECFAPLATARISINGVERIFSTLRRQHFNVQNDGMTAIKPYSVFQTRIYISISLNLEVVARSRSGAGV